MDLMGRFKDYSTEQASKKHILKRTTRFRIICVASFVIFFYVLLSFRGAFYIFGNVTGRTWSSNPIDLIINTLSQSPAYFLIALILSGLVSFGIAKVFTMDPEDRDIYSGGKIVDTGINGVKRPMTEREMRGFFDMRKPNNPDGVILGVYEDTDELVTIPWKPKNVNEALSNDNIFLVGQPGTRKTSGFLLPNIYNRMQAGHAIFTTDTKGEIYSESVAQAKYLGYDVMVFNCLGDQWENSDGWDALKYVREAEDPASIARQMATVVLKNLSNGGSEQFWSDSSINCFTLALLYVARAKGFTPLEMVTDLSEGETTADADADPYAKYRTFGEVIDLIMSGPIMVDNVGQAIETYPEDRRLMGNAYTIWATNKQAAQIQSGLGIALSIFDNEKIKNVLSHDEIDFSKLDGKKTILYVICSDKDDTYKPLLTLFTSFAFIEATRIADSKPAKKLDKPLCMFLEECGNIGELPGLAARVSTLRSRNIALFFCFQTIGQLIDTYASKNGQKHNDKTILAGTALTICTGANDDESAEYISTMSGVENIESESISENYSRFDPFQMSVDQSHRFDIKKRPVFTPDQVMKLAVTDVILIPSGDHNPTLIKKYYYVKHPLYKIKAKIPGTMIDAEPLTTKRTPRWLGGDPESYFVPVLEGGSTGIISYETENRTNTSCHGFDDFK